jgi:hypothetical protein
MRSWQLHASVSSECETWDRNCEGTDAETDERNGEQTQTGDAE